MAIQIDLIPHKEEIKVLMSDSFGKLYTKNIKISDI